MNTTKESMALLINSYIMNLVKKTALEKSDLVASASLVG